MFFTVWSDLHKDNMELEYLKWKTKKVFGYLRR